MQAVTTIGLDIAKSVFQIHGVDAAGNVIVRRQLKRRYVLPGILPSLASSHRSDAMALNNCSMWSPTQATTGCLRLPVPAFSLSAPSCGR
jgi:hypothetical protein